MARHLGMTMGRARIMPTRKKKIRPLPVHLPVGYSLKKYSRIFLKLAGTRGYPIPANNLKNIYFIIFLI